ncbi:MAG: response regulator [Verrucomicrobiota bacterium JB023]|nr:response regulator [Verrucomicrobiota bacterium JB023]
MTTIALVEDDPDERLFITRAIDQLPLEVSVDYFTDGEEAIEGLLGAEKGTYALILLDLKIPKIDGIGVLNSLGNGKSSRYTPVIVCSGSKSSQDVQRAWEAGCSGYFAKPDSPTGYREMIQTIVGYWLSPLLVSPEA